MRCFSDKSAGQELHPDKPVGSDSGRQPVSCWVCPPWHQALPASLCSCHCTRFGPHSSSNRCSFLLPSLALFQLEAFYSIFTTEQQDHVKSVEYLRNNFRPQQDLNGRVVSKSAVRDAWSRDMTDSLENPLGTEASKGMFGLSALAQRKIPYCKLV